MEILEADVSVEHGGILFGQAYSDSKCGIYVEITGAVAAPRTIYLFFKTVYNGNIYFIDESLYHSKNKDYPINNETLLDCYLLSLLEISQILEAKIIFITSSPEVIKKCRLLNFEIGTLEDSSNGECWLEPKMLLDVQASSSFDNFQGVTRIRVSPRNPDSDPLDLSKLTTWTTTISNAASETEPIAVNEQVNTSEPENLEVIQWQDIAVMEQPSGIHWIDIAPR